MIKNLFKNIPSYKTRYVDMEPRGFFFFFTIIIVIYMSHLLYNTDECIYNFTNHYFSLALTYIGIFQQSSLPVR